MRTAAAWCCSSGWMQSFVWFSRAPWQMMLWRFGDLRACGWMVQGARFGA
jgi:hypothetical protein